MANKTVGELPRASTIGLNDLFVLEQGNQAKSLTGQTLINDLADALDGHGGIVSASYNSSNHTLTITFADETTFTTGNLRGAQGVKGNTGNTGNGISSIAKTGANGLSDVYTVTFTNGNTTTFNVRNGNGIVSISKYSTSGLVDTYRCLLDDGSYESFTVTNGKSITGITLVSGNHAPGTTDTYRISFNDGTNSNFTVYNGLNGEGAVGSVNNISPDEGGNVTLEPSNIGAQAAITGLSETDVLVDADKFAIHKANSMDVLRITWANIKAKLSQVFAAKTHASTHANGGADALPNNAIIHTMITNGAVGTAKLADLSVTEGKIQNSAVSRAKLAPDALYSPIENVTAGRAITVADLGRTITAYGNSESNFVFTLAKGDLDNCPTGYEVAIYWRRGASVRIDTSGGIYLGIEGNSSSILNGKINLNNRYAMVALKKIASNEVLVTGSAEVTA